MMKFQITFATSDSSALSTLTVSSDDEVQFTDSSLTLAGVGQGQVLQFDSASGGWVSNGAVSWKETAIVAGTPISYGNTYCSKSLVFRIDKLLPPPLINGKVAKQIPLGDSLVFGSNTNSDIILDSNLGVADNHFTIFRCNDGRFALQPTGQGKLKVNNKITTQSTYLVFGDRITAGDYSLEFRVNKIVPIENPKGGVLVANNLSLVVDNGKRKILDNTSIKVVLSEFIGVLGGSGQGKSTLLNCASGITEATGGSIRVNGENLEEFVKKNPGAIGFVPQDDIVHEDLSVDDALFFSAKLKLPSSVKNKDIHDMLSKILRDLDLTLHRSKKVGKLSGGQRKRVSIASELIGRPQVLFLDEPTSGLDPATEEDVMALLREWSKNYCPVVCTTHILGKSHLFNEVIFVNQAKIVFRGPASDAPRYFGVNSLTDVYRHLNDCVLKEVDVRPYDSPKPEYLPKPETGKKTKTESPSAFSAFRTVFARQRKLLFAGKSNLILLIAQAVLLGFLVGWGVENEIQKSFLLVLASLWFGCSNASQSIVKEIEILRRERMGGLNPFIYLLSKFCFWSSVTLIQVVLFFVVIQTNSLILTEQNPSPSQIVNRYEERLSSPTLGYIATFLGVGTEIDRYPPLGLLTAFQNGLAVKLSVILLSAITGVALGLAISSSADSIVQAVLLVPILILPQIPLSGSMITVPDMAPSFRATSWISPCFQLKRLSDGGDIFGTKRPDLLNFTETPAFVLKHETDDGETDYEAHSKGTAWQNLVVDSTKEHEPLYLEIPSQGLPSKETNQFLRDEGVLAPLVLNRSDVRMKMVEVNGAITPSYFVPSTYRKFYSFTTSYLILAAWILCSLLISYIMILRNTK